jgi:hypothetical protein
MAPFVAALLGLSILAALVLVDRFWSKKGSFRQEEDLPSNSQAGAGVSAQSKATGVKLHVPTRHKDRHSEKELIEMLELRQGYFPKRFVWREQEYEVRAVERTWTVKRRIGKEKLLERRVFRVRCAEGTFEIYWDVQQEVWRMFRQLRYVSSPKS